MKRMSVVLAVLVAFSLLGCASGGGGGAQAAAGEPPFLVDLSTMTLYSVTNNPDALGAPIGNYVKNQEPMTRNWEDMMLVFPADMPDVTGYSRVTVLVQYYNADDQPIAAADSMGMASMIYDTAQNWRADSGGNTIFKTFNVGGASGTLARPRGERFNARANPGALLLQRNSGSPAAYIEVTAIAFHNDRYEP
ncbi:MAG: hypothetical protein FWB83_04145 [Treponema sp.]|nr:hypothetical protein [Treponema sp.]